MGDFWDTGPHYTYRVEWWPEAEAWEGRCLEYRGMYKRAATAGEAFERIQQAVKDSIAEWADVGGEPPESLTDHLYSGRILIRTSPMLHRRLTVEAAEQGVSLNQWVVQKLVDRPPNLDW